MLTTAIISAKDWQQFHTVSLDALNHKSAMLTRLDNKYIVSSSILRLALQQFATHFDILEIDQNCLFNYDSFYFDDPDFRCYFDHHQGRRQRIKVRTRKYVESNLCFVEVKLKDSRGITVKKRMPYPVEQFGKLSSLAIDFINEQHFEFYGKKFSDALVPTLQMSYGRATLVAKQGGERITIDRQIRFKYNGQTYSTDDDIFVIETKSSNGNGIADSILRTLHQHRSNRCSKYCIGLCVTQQISRFNNFMPILRRLGFLTAKSSSEQSTIFEHTRAPLDHNHQ